MCSDSIIFNAIIVLSALFFNMLKPTYSLKFTRCPILDCAHPFFPRLITSKIGKKNSYEYWFNMLKNPCFFRINLNISKKKRKSSHLVGLYLSHETPALATRMPSFLHADGMIKKLPSGETTTLRATSGAVQLKRLLQICAERKVPPEERVQVHKRRRKG